MRDGPCPWVCEGGLWCQWSLKVVSACLRQSSRKARIRTLQKRCKAPQGLWVGPPTQCLGHELSSRQCGQDLALLSMWLASQQLHENLLPGHWYIGDLKSVPLAGPQKDSASCYVPLGTALLSETQFPYLQTVQANS